MEGLAMPIEANAGSKAKSIVKTYGTMFNIQRLSLDNGPGLRTALFFKGCNLRCAWCHSPESFLPEIQLCYDPTCCTKCRRCEAVCPQAACSFDENGVRRISAAKCNFCGSCEAVCPASAIEVIGKQYSLSEAMGIIRQDIPHYKQSGGGITCSGGEPTLQPVFLKKLLFLCKKEGIHTCLETNGVLPAELLRELAPLTDLFLLDLKHNDKRLHMHYTGGSLQSVLDSIDVLQELSKQVILRCPIIPTINDTAEQFFLISRLRHEYSCIKNVEFMPYRDTAFSKWERLGLHYSLPKIKPPSEKTQNDWKKRITSK